MLAGLRTCADRSTGSQEKSVLLIRIRRSTCPPREYPNRDGRLDDPKFQSSPGASESVVS